MKDQIIKQIANKLLRQYMAKYRSDQTWAWKIARESIKEASASEKQHIAQLLETTSPIQKHIKNLANEEAAAMLIDDKIDVQELNRILNG